MTELSDNDKQRIRLEARNRFLQSDRDQNFIDGAEYATKYEREQLIDRVTNLLTSFEAGLLPEDYTGKKLREIVEIELFKPVEAERTELRNKMQKMEDLLKQLHNSGYLTTTQRERVKAIVKLP